MTGEVLTQGDPLEFLNQPCLADACLAAHIEGESATHFPAAGNDTAELTQFAMSTHQPPLNSARIAAPQASHAPDRDRPVETLDGNRADIFPIEAVQQRLMDCIGSEGFARSSQRRQPGGKIH